MRENDTNVLRKLHKDDTKRIINNGKFASNMTVQGEPARFPLLHKHGDSL